MKLRKTVIVTWTQPGFHRWPEADRFPEVSYLKHPHRHLFHFRVEVSVQDSNREVEFHILLDRAKGCVPRTLNPLFPSIDNVSSLSCEQIAETILRELTEVGFFPTACEVWEDGECGARVEVC